MDYKHYNCGSKCDVCLDTGGYKTSQFVMIAIIIVSKIALRSIVVSRVSWIQLFRYKQTNKHFGDKETFIESRIVKFSSASLNVNSNEPMPTCRHLEKLTNSIK